MVHDGLKTNRENHGQNVNRFTYIYIYIYMLLIKNKIINNSNWVKKNWFLKFVKENTIKELKEIINK